MFPWTLLRARRTPWLAVALALFARVAAAQNPVVTENALPGNPPSEWDVSGAGDPSIQGFTTDISVNHGGTVFFKIATPSTQYRIDVYRIGWYGGNGARKVATVHPSVTLPQVQPAPLTDAATGLVDCGNWAVSASWNVPAAAVSGIYVAKLVREDTTGAPASHVLFVVRDDERHSDLLLQANDETWHAYNTYGGNSLYNGAPAGRAYKVSYNRPFTTRCCNYPDGAIVTWFFSAPYPMVRWLEANGYDVGYASGVDTDRFPAHLLDHKVFVSVGHDEYWSGAQRANVEAARDAGVNLAFFSGNEVFWKTRWETSIDGSGTPYRTLACYKETHAGAKIDPLPGTWTGTWRDPRFSPPADGGRPENALLGTIFVVNGVTENQLAVPEADGKMRFWRNTSVATLAPGQTAAFATGTLGFEWDTDLDNGFRPAGLFHLSSATWSGVPVLQDYGSTFATGTATHHLTMYRAASGARVFSAGTVQWSWGLDATHDNPGTPADPRMQQATVNLFADMGAQPGSLQPGLVAASASTDALAPVSGVTTPLPGASVAAGNTVTIAGTASDAGGRVGGIEVSVDGGATWHPAEGRESWTYGWTPADSGSATIRSRAVDDSGNLESPGAGIAVHVTPPQPGTCPCTIFAVSGGAASSDAASVEVGVRFRSDRDGFVRGLRFWKPDATNGGSHVGHLWTNAGAALATATFANETPSGWQEVLFGAGNDVPVTAGTLYVASVLMPQGHYAAATGWFAAHDTDRAPLHAPQDGAGGFANGVYAYGSGGFPTSTFASANYWVDVVFDTLATSAPPCAADRTAADFAQGTFGPGTFASTEIDGEVTLAPSAGSAFDGSALPAGWSGEAWSAGGAATVSGGALHVDGARAATDSAYGAGRALEFVATFGSDAFQHVGFVSDLAFDSPWAMFSTFGGGGLWARTSDGANTAIAGSWLGAPHRYRIDWSAGGFQFAIDGATVAASAFTVGTPMRPLASDFTVGGAGLALGELRLAPYAASGSYTSRVVDAGTLSSWGAASWTADVPAGTSLALLARTGNTPAPDGTWSAFTPIAGNGASVGRTARYLQYRADLATSDPARTPVVRDVSVACSPAAGSVAPEGGPFTMRAPTIAPNPVGARTTIAFAISPIEAPAGRVAVEVVLHDVQGRVVRVLERRELAPGRYEVAWDARDDGGARVRAGVYYVRLRVGDTSARRAVVVLR